MTKIEPVACYAGHRSTPEGTKEFYGYADKPLEPATMFYTEAQMRRAMEACAAVCNDADKSTHPSDLADAIRNLIKEVLGWPNKKYLK